MKKHTKHTKLKIRFLNNSIQRGKRKFLYLTFVYFVIICDGIGIAVV